MLAAVAVNLRSAASRAFSKSLPNSTFSLSPLRSRFSIRAMADSAGPFKKVQIQRDDTAFDAYIVGKEDAPGIVVLQEWWGVDFEIKNHAVKISELAPGFKALIPDLYRGKVGLDVAEAQHLMDGLDWQGAVKDIQASVNWLKANGSKKVGVTGFCMGGALSIASSVLVPEVDAVVAFYGVPSSELADPAQAKAPIQAHFGELDSFVGFSDVTAAKALFVWAYFSFAFKLSKVLCLVDHKMRGFAFKRLCFQSKSQSRVLGASESLKRFQSTVARFPKGKKSEAGRRKSQMEKRPTTMSMSVRGEMEKLSVEQLKAVKEQKMSMNDSLNNIRTATTRLELTSSALHDLSLRPSGKKMLVPITASLYVPGTLQDPDQVLVNVGTGYFIEKNMPQAKDYCDRKISLLKSNFFGYQFAWLVIRTLASFQRADSASAAKLYDFLSPRFYAFYSVFRGVLGPLFMFKMGLFYMSGAAGEEVPTWAWVSWMVVIVIAICVSILWVLSHWKDWYRDKVQKKEK